MELDEHMPDMFWSQNTQSTMHHQMMTFRLRMTMRIPKRVPMSSMRLRMTMRIPMRIPIRSMSLRTRILGSPLRILMRLNRSRKTRLLSHHHHLDTVERGYLSSLRPMAASTQALIDAFAAGRDDIPEEDMPPQRRFAFTTPSPGCDVAESSAAAASQAPRSQYDFVNTVEAGHGLIRSPGHNTRTISRAADRVEDVGYVRALQASVRRMMTSIEEVNLRVSYQA
uniref:Uncharacterized protein n=1 Tax=Tanacetum cinerariifolium TaxID=118510 RepID=A0A699S1F3_TANCI|nr:hypothetical protein [Tanacetum cinerariifolium]